MKVDNLVVEEFQALGKHVEDLEQKCIVGDFKGLESKVDGIREDLETCWTGRGKGTG
jgi:hypothetical protein